MQGLLQTVIQQALDQQRLVGVEVMVAQRGEIIYHQAAGWADRENQRPMAKRGAFPSRVGEQTDRFHRCNGAGGARQCGNHQHVRHVC